MDEPIPIVVHRSQFPRAVEQSLRQSLRDRKINHKFHYNSYQQVSQWLAVHERYSPARTDPECQAIYDHAFTAATRQTGRKVHIVGLGAGGGQKDVRLLELLAQQRKTVSYSPLDISAPMVLSAALAAKPLVHNPTPIMADLAEADDLGHLLDQTIAKECGRLYTFFGMIPNFEPDAILPRLATLLPNESSLLFSANLAPGSDYRAGVEGIKRLYANEETEAWLLTFLLDLGFKKSDGEMAWSIEGGAYLRLTAEFELKRDRSIRVSGEAFDFRVGEKIRLFFSYRYTADLIRELLRDHGFEVSERWITASQEEGVFLCRRR